MDNENDGKGCDIVNPTENESSERNKIAHIPNGCLKHSLEPDNGIVKIVTGGARPKNQTCINHAEPSEEVCDDGMHENTSDRASGVDVKEVPVVIESNSVSEVSESLCEMALADTTPTSCDAEYGLRYVVYESEKQMPDIMRLITKDLSEPYSIYTYRYFIHNWPKLCFLAREKDKCVGAIVCKLDMHKKMMRRGYIAMLAIDEGYRRRGIGSHLVMKAIRAMVEDDCDEVVLETEITNRAALRLYENLGFVRDKRLFRYYLNGVDALRLKLWLR